MNSESRSSRWLPWLVSGGAALLVLAGWVHANRAGAVGAPPLAGVGSLADAWVRAGEALVDASGRVVGALRLPALLGLAVWLGQRLWRRQPPGSTAGLCAALALGWLAQSYLLDLRIAVGLALYGVAAAVYLWGRQAPQAFAERMPPRVELGAALLLLALFAFVCLHRLDVHPPSDFDEIAYLQAARMTLGEIEPRPLGVAYGGHSYSLERFQAQVVPHALQVAAVSALAPGILQIRLVARLSGPRWHLYTIPEHLFFYSRRSLRLLLEAHGFRIETERADSSVYTLGYLVERLRKTLLGRARGERGTWPGSELRIPVNLFDIVTVQAVREGIS